MRIGILSFHASHNYGSMLQAYALQQYLQSIGHEVEIINLRTEAQKRLYAFPMKLQKGNKKKLLMSLLNPIWLLRECAKWYKYESFLRHNLKLSDKEYKSWEAIKDDLPKLRYQCIITGGDQIWNLSCADFDAAYFLPSKLNGISKISYSPSFGNMLPYITKKEELFIKENLADYSFISVREKSMQDYLSQQLNRQIEVLIDPTLLLNLNYYSKILIKKPLIEKKYIYYYSPWLYPNVESLALRISRLLELPIVTSSPHIIFKRGFETAPVTGPAEFINLIENAALVIGNSYHLVIFSLLFHKEFISIGGEKDARIKDILSRLSLTERGMVNEENYKTISLPTIDFEKVDRIITEMRHYSMTSLKSFLEAENKST